MSKSILQNRENKECYLCRILGTEQECVELEEHHIMFGRQYRRKSEHYGLKVMLCIPHHRTGKDAVHRNAEINTLLRQIAQVTFERKHSHELWMKEFGRNYIDDEIRERYLGKKEE